MRIIFVTNTSVIIVQQPEYRPSLEYSGKVLNHGTFDMITGNVNRTMFVLENKNMNNRAAENVKIIIKRHQRRTGVND